MLNKNVLRCFQYYYNIYQQNHGLARTGIYLFYFGKNPTGCKCLTFRKSFEYKVNTPPIYKIEEHGNYFNHSSLY